MISHRLQRSANQARRTAIDNPDSGTGLNDLAIRVFITTDAQVAPSQMIDFRNMADFIFQDCEIAKFWSTVHAHYNELISLDDDVSSPLTKSALDARGLL